MKKLLLIFFSLLVPVSVFSQDSDFQEKADIVFQKYTQWFVDFIFYQIPFSENFKVPWVVILLIGSAIFCTLFFRFINIRDFKTAINILRGKYQDVEDAESDDREVEGEVSHFQALATAISATVGLGNIAGVGVAISIGGPGATFWMIVGGLLGMSLKFAECTLGVKYRDIGPDGTVYGGPMYYLQKGLAERNMKGLGKTLAIVFAVLVMGGAFGIGNMFQANQASVQAASLFDLGPNGGSWVGLVLALVVGLVIVGGIKRIAKVTERLVPFMAILYILTGLVVVGVNYMHIMDAFRVIFDGAFTGAGISGGAAGVMIQGFRRSTFSNEAGIGSAPTAHAAVKTKFPVSEGLVSLLEPFIDTVVICTMTALIIIIANFDHNIVEYGQAATEGVSLTAAAFDTVIPHYSIMLTIVVILFAVSTMITWSYYGLQGWAYLFGRKKSTLIIYNIIFCVFIWLGSGISLGAVVEFSDAMNFAMAVPNLIGVLILTPVVLHELKRFKNAVKEEKLRDKEISDFLTNND